MTARAGHVGRTIALAIFPALLWVSIPLQGVAVAHAVEAGSPDRPCVDNVPRERLERWKAMPPEERARIRERYHQWKELSPEEQERIRERHRRWRELPEERRRYLKERRELLKSAGEEDRAVVQKFFARMHSLPPDTRKATREKIWGWRALPPGEREEAMRSWPFYQDLSGPERESLRWFLFARPEERSPRE